MDENLTLGRAIGYLQLQRDGSFSVETPALSPEGKDYLERLSEILQKLENQNDALPPLKNIPLYPCELDRPYLNQNEPFFLAFFLIPGFKMNCSDLFVHLNNCFSCASIFSDMLRDYHQALHKD